MQHAEISRDLALAIGYLPEHVKIERFRIGQARIERCAVMYRDPVFGLGWKTFDYRDATVIWPIAERYDCFPTHRHRGLDGWGAVAQIGTRVSETAACSTAAAAAALAVIGASK